jgi:hypothetical protein
MCYEMLVYIGGKKIVYEDNYPLGPGNRRDDGGSKRLWNIGLFLPDYMAQHPIIKSS